MKVWAGVQNNIIEPVLFNGIQSHCERTTEGMNGGVIFLAIRSSQLIGEKKEWCLSSSYRGNEILGQQSNIRKGLMNLLQMSVLHIHMDQLWTLTKSSFTPTLLVRSFCKSPSSSSLPAFETLGLSTGALCKMLLYISAVLRL